LALAGDELTRAESKLDVIQRRDVYRIVLAALLVACRPVAPSADHPTRGRPAVIPFDAGERAWLDSARFTTLKVDPKSVGAERFALGAEALPPGSAIPVHRHLADEELLIVHRGRAAVTLGDSGHVVEAGGVAYIPRGTWVGVANPGPDTLTIFYIFPTPHFLEYMRAIASPSPGGRRLSRDEAATINREHRIEYRPR
jgi:quercetin dioxygenase-like cupin family protein